MSGKSTAFEIAEAGVAADGRTVDHQHDNFGSNEHDKREMIRMGKEQSMQESGMTVYQSTFHN